MQIKNISKEIKFITLILLDFSTCLFSSLLTYIIFNRILELSSYSHIFFLSIFSFIILLISFYHQKLYKSIHRFSGSIYYEKLIIGLLLFLFFYISIFILNNIIFYKLNIILIISNGIIIFLLTIINRFFIIKITANQTKPNLKNILIFGAGEAGVQVLKSLSNSSLYKVSAFIDDDKNKISRSINNINVYSKKNIESIIKKYLIKEVFIAIPSLNNDERKKLISDLEKLNITTKLLPKIEYIIEGNVNFLDLKKPNLDDLIDRKIKFNSDELKNLIFKKTVLVTGAGGSIGSELCRQIFKYKPKKIIMLDHSEYNLYKIKEEISLIKSNNNILDVEIIFTLGSINNLKVINELVAKHQPQIVYHAAAYKHVPLTEDNILVAVENNIIGTYNIANLILKSKSLEKFILISTDKAVRPTSIMGKTKRISELYIQALAEKEINNNIFSIVRFGNVLGSSGSVVPLFYRQIKNGGPITVTNKSVTRYLMSISEAVGLILNTTKLAKGGEVFLLDMGTPIKILDLAKKIIALSGLTEKNNQNPEGDIEIKISGLRPGEKLYEELLVDKNAIKTNFDYIFKVKEKGYQYEDIKDYIETLNIYLNNSQELKVLEEVKNILKIDK